VRSPAWAVDKVKQNRRVAGYERTIQPAARQIASREASIRDGERSRRRDTVLPLPSYGGEGSPSIDPLAKQDPATRQVVPFPPKLFRPCRDL